MRALLISLLLASTVLAAECGDFQCTELEEVVCPQDCAKPAPQQGGEWIFVLMASLFILIATIGWFLSSFSIKQDSFYPQQAYSEEPVVQKRVKSIRKRLK
ncbi:hypothetical protein HUU53_03785 [Candidatus Micrarchaeota archaeon]|nr:hypothetical protein [Candidatus Micrarchaeota archaeon]